MWLAGERGGPEYSRSLPPPEAWKHPDRWLDPHTHKARHDASRLYLHPDDRGFLLPNSGIGQVQEAFFWNDYDWPFDPRDTQTRPDDHHMHYERRLYLPDMHGGDTTAREFRESAAMKARVPRQMHNTIHQLTIMPEMPRRDAMREFVDSYYLARNVFKKLYLAAALALETSRKFNIDDQIDEELLRSTFTEQFRSYSDAMEEFNNLPVAAKTNLDPRLIDAPLNKPSFVVHKLGVIATRASIDLTPLLRRVA